MASSVLEPRHRRARGRAGQLAAGLFGSPFAIPVRDPARLPSSEGASDRGSTTIRRQDPAGRPAGLGYRRRWKGRVAENR